MDRFASQEQWLFRLRVIVLSGLVPLFIFVMTRPEPIEITFGDFWDSAYESFCIALAFAGLGIRAYSAGSTSSRISGTARPHLQTSGIYSLTRNPMLLGSSVIYVSIGLFTQSVWMVLVMTALLAVYLKYAIAAQDRALEQKFGAAYARWAGKVPPVFPRFTGWQEPAHLFSFRQMLRRESSTLFLVVSIFFAMDQGREYLTKHAQLDAGWLVFLLVGAIIYLVLTAIEKHTGLLHVPGEAAAGDIAAPDWTDAPASRPGSFGLAKLDERYWPYGVLAVLFAATIVFRPLLPIDETRYLSVSWEMLLTKSFIVPTMNFAPYFQKPPLLFWLIDIVWSLFGVSRISALLVPFGASVGTIYLSVRLARSLFPEDEAVAERASWLLLGNAAFLVYSSVIFFDVLLAVFVLAAALAFLAFSKGRGLRFALLAGLFIGLGGLTKGPVILIHVGWMALLYPVWRDPQSDLPMRKFFAGVALSLLVAVGVGLLWLIPVVLHSGSDYVYNLVWKQAIGRVEGDVKGSHSRPIYFYLLLLPIAALPWYLSPYFWRAKAWAGRHAMPVTQKRAARLLLLWSLGVLVTFSLIAGKQPHYIVPIVPVAIVALAYFMRAVPLDLVRKGAIVTVAVFCVGEAVGTFTIFREFNLAPIARYVAERRNAPWAFEGHYEAQFNFLARLEKPITVIKQDAQAQWLDAHPDGYVIRAYRNAPPAHALVSAPVRKGYLAVLGGRGAK